LKKSTLRSLATMVFVVFAIVVLVFPGSAYASDDTSLEYLKTVIEMVMERYRGEITEEQLIEGALKGIFDTMDVYTTYYTLDEAESFLLNIEGTYQGIGVTIEKSETGVVIVKVFDSTPAHKAGLSQGDVIITIDGINVKERSLEEVAALIKGEVGTKVVLGVMKAGSRNVTIIEVVREKIKISPVTYEIRDGDIGYIKIEMFNSNSAEFVNEALKYLDNKGITKVILDLRNNPGGEVIQAVNIAKKFVPRGVITTLDFKSEKTEDLVYHSDLDKVKYDLVLLVNESTASASEILAGAVQDTGSGILVGTNTFGKALVQNLIPILTPQAYEKYRKQLNADVVDAYELINDYGVSPLQSEIMGWTKITTGVYITPSGKVLEEGGLVPDYYAEGTIPVNGVYVDTISRLTKSERLKLNSQGADVENAEKILKALGYDVDTPDTLLDNKTYKAIRKFQNDEGLYSHGILDSSTQDVLNGKINSLLWQCDLQYLKAVELLKMPQPAQ
jgi:carboxyl-terminal processing protease